MRSKCFHFLKYFLLPHFFFSFFYLWVIFLDKDTHLLFFFSEFSICLKSHLICLDPTVFKVQTLPYIYYRFSPFLPLFPPCPDSFWIQYARGWTNFPGEQELVRLVVQLFSFSVALFGNIVLLYVNPSLLILIFSQEFLALEVISYPCLKTFWFCLPKSGHSVFSLCMVILAGKIAYKTLNFRNYELNCIMNQKKNWYFEVWK